jgi:hypothetical protein
MHIMTLIADMRDLDMLALKMLRHDHRFDDIFGPGVNSSVMTSQAQHPNFLVLSNRHRCYFLAVLNVIGIGTVTEFAGNGLVKPFQMHLGLVLVTGHAGSVCPMSDFPVGLFFD